MLLYLLRSEVRAKQGNLSDAFSDIVAVQQSPQAALYASIIARVQEHSVSCSTFFSATAK
jgi:hypothetical protein